MAFVIADRVQETTTTTGTGTVVLSGAVTGYQTFAVIGNTNQTYYTIADQSGTNWEVGVGTYYSGNLSLARTTVLASSNSNAAVTFGVGTKAVFVTYPAERAIYADSSNITTITNFASANVLITGGTINGVTISNATYSGLGTMSTQNANSVTITGGSAALANALVGSNASFTDFPYAQMIVSQGNTGDSHIYNMGVAAEAVGGANSSVWGVGLYGAGRTSTSASSVGVLGDGGVTNSSDTQPAIGIRGYSTQTHAGGRNIALYASAANSSVNNLALEMAAGDIQSDVAQTWTLAGNLTFTGANVVIPSLAVTGPVTANASTGTSGQVLTSNGATGSVYWSTVSGGGGSNVGIGNSSIIVINTNITANATITAGQNGFSVGPVNTANGITVTVASGQRWVII
jgi:hypothetical protein